MEGIPTYVARDYQKVKTRFIFSVI